MQPSTEYLLRTLIRAILFYLEILFVAAFAYLGALVASVWGIIIGIITGCLVLTAFSYYNRKEEEKR